MIDIKVKVSWNYIEQMKDDAKPLFDEIKKLLDEGLNEKYTVKGVFREHGPFGGNEGEPSFTVVGWTLKENNDNLNTLI